MICLTTDEQYQHDKIFAFIKSKLQTNNTMSFHDYMQHALYHPQYGYYQGQKRIFAGQGDFVTAPELSPLFAHCIANFCQVEFKDYSILELGAGTGQFALDLLSRLLSLKAAPNNYYILELSAELKAQQMNKLQDALPQYFGNVIWLTTLDNFKMEGLIFANEVLDAMPVHRFLLNDNKLHQVNVKLDSNNNLDWSLAPAKSLLKSNLKFMLEQFDAMSYLSEINLWTKPWLNSLSKVLIKGKVLLIDYGMPQHEYYHPNRHGGSLICHFRQQAHDNPLILTGIQDITAQVNFTQVAQCAFDNGFEILAYANQASFLIECGLFERSEALNASMSAKILTSPSEMGEKFKVMCLGKKQDDEVFGFKNYNQLNKLNPRI